MGPLAGIAVLDFTTSLSGPLAAGILADLGADVVKVERPTAPDRARVVGTRRGDVSAMFQLANRGKRSVALDLRDPAELSVAHELAKRVDVVVENFRPGVTERIGIDYATLCALNPDLVYVSISGFGSTGPYATRPGFDSLLQAYGGFAALQEKDGVPELVGHAVCDKVAGMIGAQSAMAALLARDRGRGGQRIDVSMLDVAAWFVHLDAAGSTTLPDAPAGRSDDATTGQRMTVRYADGWGILSLGHDDSFRAICEVFGVGPADELRTWAGRDENPELVHDVLAKVREAAAGMPRAVASAALAEAGAMFGDVLTPAEIPHNEQVVARELFVESMHPTAGRVVEPRLPARFSVTEPPPPGPSPALDQHGTEIRNQMGGRAHAE